MPRSRMADPATGSGDEDRLDRGARARGGQCRHGEREADDRGGSCQAPNAHRRRVTALLRSTDVLSATTQPDRLSRHAPSGTTMQPCVAGESALPAPRSRSPGRRSASRRPSRRSGARRWRIPRRSAASARGARRATRRDPGGISARGRAGRPVRSLARAGGSRPPGRVRAVQASGLLVRQGERARSDGRPARLGRDDAAVRRRRRARRQPGTSRAARRLDAGGAAGVGRPRGSRVRRRRARCGICRAHRDR